MDHTLLQTPVLFTVFNRPDTTRQVFEAIRAVRPARLFVASDGPRTDRSGEAATVEAVRAIATRVDWECELKTLFRTENLGCRAAMSSAIDWFFSEVEEGIILEDDCLPDPSFFPYCVELLDRYREDERVMIVSGCNMQLGRHPVADSYYFSRYIHIWGWASWRRAWKHYDVDMKDFPEFQARGVLDSILRTPQEKRRWSEILERVHQRSPHFDTWDFQWNYALFKRNALAVTPNFNLVRNIGCGTGALHTADNSFAEAEAEQMPFPLQHPPFQYPLAEADAFTFRHDYSVSLRKRIANRLRKAFG